MDSDYQQEKQFWVPIGTDGYGTSPLGVARHLATPALGVTFRQTANSAKWRCHILPSSDVCHVENLASRPTTPNWPKSRQVVNQLLNARTLYGPTRWRFTHIIFKTWPVFLRVLRMENWVSKISICIKFIFILLNLNWMLQSMFSNRKKQLDWDKSQNRKISKHHNK